MDKQAIQSAYKARRGRQILISILALVGVVVMLYAYVNPAALAPLKPLQIMLLALVYEVGLLAASLLNWRCPNCNKYLGRGYNPESCRRCNAKLR